VQVWRARMRAWRAWVPRSQSVVGLSALLVSLHLVPSLPFPCFPRFLPPAPAAHVWFDAAHLVFRSTASSSRAASECLIGHPTDPIIRCLFSSLAKRMLSRELAALLTQTEFALTLAKFACLLYS
jgi:hypothetical protein